MNFLQYKEIIKEEFKDDYFILGIDLGATNSVVCYFNNKTKKAEPIDLSNGFGKIPIASSVQYRSETNEWIVGEEALKTSEIYINDTIDAIKLMLGKVDKVKLGDEFYTPAEILSKIIKSITDSVIKKSPKAEIIGLVVTVPKDFSEIKKAQTIEAIEIAGYKDKFITLCSEQSATLLNHYVENDYTKNQRVAIFDFGGKALNLSLFDTVLGEKISVKLLKQVSKDNHGGDNIDKIILDKFYSFIEENGISKDLLTKENIAELKMKAIDTKERLSGVNSYRVPFTFCVPPFVKQITAEELESWIAEFIQLTKIQLKNLFLDVNGQNVDFESVDKVIITGGVSQMPWVRKMLVEVFGEEKVISSNTELLDCAKGACIYAAYQMGVYDLPEIKVINEKVIKDIEIPFDIGFEINNEFFAVIKRGSSYNYCRKENNFALKDSQNKDLELTVLKRKAKSDKLVDCEVLGKLNFANMPSFENIKIVTQILNGTELSVCASGESYENQQIINLQ